MILLAAACVDESDHLTLVNAGDEEVVSQEGGREGSAAGGEEGGVVARALSLSHTCGHTQLGTRVRTYRQAPRRAQPGFFFLYFRVLSPRELRGGGEGGGFYSYSSDTVEGPRAPAVKLTARHCSLTRVTMYDSEVPRCEPESFSGIFFSGIFPGLGNMYVARVVYCRAKPVAVYFDFLSLNL